MTCVHNRSQCSLTDRVFIVALSIWEGRCKSGLNITSSDQPANAQFESTGDDVDVIIMHGTTLLIRHDVDDVSPSADHCTFGNSRQLSSSDSLTLSSIETIDIVAA